MAQRKSGSAPKKKTKKPRQPRIALHLPKPAYDLYARCLAIWTALKNDPVHFPSPYPSAAEIDADLTALEAALQKWEAGGTIETAAVETAAQKVRATFELVGKYVQKVVREGPIEDAPKLIANVLMYVSNAGTRPPKRELEARAAANSGWVRLIALAVPGAVAYAWEWSLDQQSWTLGAETAQARAFVPGLTPGKTYYFRVRALLRDNTKSDYSQAVSWIVT